MSLVILQHLLGFFQLISILMKIIVKGAIEMDNPDTLATLDIQDEGKQNKKHNTEN